MLKGRTPRKSYTGGAALRKQGYCPSRDMEGRLRMEVEVFLHAAWRKEKSSPPLG